MRKTFITHHSSLIIPLLLLAAMPTVRAQRLPHWMNELPQPGNPTYLYVREAGEGPTLAEAESQALLRVMQSTALRLGRPFDAAEVEVALSQGTTLQALSRQYNIPILKVDQYEQSLSGGYRVWVLCQVAVSGNIQPQWEALRRGGEASGWVALAKSAVVPGLGQMGKGHTAEGLLTLGAEALLAGTGVGCYFMARHRLEVMRDPSTPFAHWTSARNAYNTLRTVSLIAWGAAAVLYAFNLYRAFSVQPRRATGLALGPAALPVGGGVAPTLSLTLNF